MMIELHSDTHTSLILTLRRLCSVILTHTLPSSSHYVDCAVNSVQPITIQFDWFVVFITEFDNMDG